ncbi:MAG TPA: hypothetical protein VEU28_09955 [Actinomycetota bacterium]|nr:hypothetical protein [Actinomycetota bacterium]
MYEDDAENARAALRALWAASGQLDGSDSLGQEKEVTFPVDRSEGNDGKGGLGGHFGSERHETVGLQDFAKNNEPTFDRGEAASKLKDAWRSTLTAEGKMGSGKKTLGDAAKETTAKAARVRSAKPAEPEDA